MMKYKETTIEQLSASLTLVAGRQISPDELLSHLDGLGYPVKDIKARDVFYENEVRELVIAFDDRQEASSLGSASQKLGKNIVELGNVLVKSGLPIRMPLHESKLISKEELSLLEDYYSLYQYFNLDIEDHRLASAGNVEKGTHGIEFLESGVFATHFHIKHFAIGSMKRFVESISSQQLYAKARNENKDFDRWPIVSYEGQNYVIQKYKLSWLLTCIELEDSEPKSATKEIVSVPKPGAFGLSMLNFRRFVQLPFLEFSPVTLMVGRNNSGKSTVVKGLLLVLDYLKNQQGDRLSFSKGTMNEANIMTFDRAKTNFNDEPFIEFTVLIGEFQVSMHIHGDKYQTDADIDWVRMVHLEKKTTLHIDFLKNEARIDLDNSKGVDVNLYSDLVTRIEDLNNQIKTIDHTISTLGKMSNEAFKLRAEKTEILEKIELIQKEKNMIELASKEEDLHYRTFSLTSTTRTIKEVIDEIQQILTEEEEIKKKEYELSFDRERDAENQKKAEYSLLLDKLKEMASDDKFTEEDAEEVAKTMMDEIYAVKEAESADAIKKEDIQFFGESFTKSTEKINFHFIGADITRQRALYNIREKDNMIAQAIHEYFQLRINKDDLEGVFVLKWMNEFEVGDDFEITPVAGEAYEFNVVNNKHVVSLSDKGMGSIQVMTIILRVASLIRKSKTTKGNHIIFMEEPELNLHPKLQSLLADFFHDVSVKYGFRFIIETHSEYLVRKTQLIGLEKGYFEDQELNENPFKVYYFHYEEGPYVMEYREDGVFKNNFGTGFFDVASQHAMKLIAGKKRR